MTAMGTEKRRLPLIALCLIAACAALGCRDYGILETDNEQIAALKRLGANVEHTMTGQYIVKLNDSGIGDSGMVHFSKLNNVSGVGLDGAKITDAGVKPIAEGSKDVIIALSVSNTGIGDAALDTIGEMKNLQNLILNNTDITDAGMANLQKLTQLTGLTLDGCQNITDDGLKNLVGLPLKGLGLNKCKGITDAGLEHLKKIRSLEGLGLVGTRCTPAGVDSLRKSLGGLIAGP